MSDPHNLEAEEHVIGAMLVNEKVIERVVEIIGEKGDAFYRTSHQVIYRAALALFREAKPVDPIAVVDLLERHGRLAEAGGRERVAEIVAMIPTTANVAHYASIVIEQARLRDILAFSRDVERLLGPDREGRTSDELIDATEALLSEVRDHFSGSEGEERTAFEMAEFLDDRMKNPPDDSHGVPVPWAGLDRMMPGRLYVLGGYQADGKTAMAGEFIARASHHVPVGFASLEMIWQDVAIRMASNLGANARTIESGKVPEVERDRAQAAIARLAMMNVRVRYESRPTVAALRRWQRRHRFGLLVVDHLHQFPIEDYRHERALLDRIVRDLQVLAVAERVPVLLLAQLSRVGDPKKPYPRPTMASLRGTAMIEALAWCVWFVWRKRDEKNLPTNEAEFIVAKNRSGSPGSFDLDFNPRHVRFTQATEGES